MTRYAITVGLVAVGFALGLAITLGLDELDLPVGARIGAGLIAIGAVYWLARLVILLVVALRARRHVRRVRAANRELVEAKLAEVRELNAPDELPRAPDPTPGTVRRARQSRGRRTPRARKRRTGRWG